MAKRRRRKPGIRWQQLLFWVISLLVALSMVLAYVLVGSPPPPPPTPTPAVLAPQAPTPTPIT